jgi:hypothetical protein
LATSVFGDISIWRHHCLAEEITAEYGRNENLMKFLRSDRETMVGDWTTADRVRGAAVSGHASGKGSDTPHDDCSNSGSPDQSFCGNGFSKGWGDGAL